MQKLLLKLYDHAEKLFKKEFFAVGFTVKDFETFRAKMREAGAGNQPLFLKTVFEAIRKKKFKDYSEMNGFARAYQAFDNHFPHPDALGRPMSAFLFSAMRETGEAGRSVPKNWKTYMKLSHEAHAAIERFFNKWKRYLEKEGKALSIKLQKITGDKESASGFFHFDETIVKISHHTLDWYLQVSAFNAYRKPPEKLAAIAIDIVKEVNQAATGLCVSDIDRNALAKFGGYASASSLASSSRGAFYDILYNVKDPELLLIDPMNAPENWRKELRKVAPAMSGKVQDFIDDMPFSIPKG